MRVNHVLHLSYTHAMERVTITMTDDLEEALEVYRRDQEVVPSFTAVAQAALREFLVGRGYLSKTRYLRITPADKGNGASDVSVNHDRYLATR